MSRLPSHSHPQPSSANDQRSIGREIATYALAIAVSIAFAWALDLDSTYGVALGMTIFAAVRIAYLIWQRKRT